MGTGWLVVAEGVEGAGKTTQLRRLAQWLEARGARTLVVREPGQTAVGDQIRRLLLDEPARELDARTEALLFMASRAELVARVITPALAAGVVVLADRFFLSTYAYQAAGRGLPESEVRAANALATGGLVPDLTLLFDLPVGEGLARAERRGTPDRLERATAAFHARVAAAFAAALDPAWQREHPECGVIARIDAGGDTEVVFARVRAAVTARWPSAPPGA